MHQCNRQSTMPDRLRGIEGNAAPRVFGTPRDQVFSPLSRAEEDGLGYIGDCHRGMRSGKARVERDGAFEESPGQLILRSLNHGVMPHPAMAVTYVTEA